MGYCNIKKYCLINIGQIHAKPDQVLFKALEDFPIQIFPENSHQCWPNIKKDTVELEKVQEGQLM